MQMVTHTNLPEVTKADCGTPARRDRWAVMRRCERTAREYEKAGDLNGAADFQDRADRAARDLEVLLKAKGRPARRR